MTTLAPDLRHEVGHVARLATHLEDARDLAADVFVDAGAVDWGALDWGRLGRPYRVERWARGRFDWEVAHGQPLPVKEGWSLFNRSFQRLFDTDIPAAMARARGELGRAVATLDLAGAREAVRDLVQLGVWNRVHRVEDAVWDPRGKRALFAGLDVRAPRILFLGAADGYEGMQLAAMYPGAHVVLVDYDPWCVEGRFGAFPARYPFLGADPATGGVRVWHRDEMHLDYEVSDIRDLRYGREFDIVLSVGLLEHFPDAHKPLAFEMHRRFLRPGGYALMTTPRDQLRGRLFYDVMADVMNFGYRELMDLRHLGRYAWENGFEILRAGHIKAHNGLVARAR
ncbi:MAG: class I SAM-dependent methyltransferase [Gemmatimonadales bacterium]|nr:class I SAM-dependent methyltransferase [Gemmatimonadales bacterium]